MTDIDRFVEYLISELCQGCTECEPRLSDEWNETVCLHQNDAKWMMEMAKNFQKEANQ